MGDANVLSGSHFFGGGINAVYRAFVTASGEARIGFGLRIAVLFRNGCGPDQPLLVGSRHHQPFRHIGKIGGDVVNLRLLPVEKGTITDDAERKSRQKQRRKCRKAAPRTFRP